MRRPVPWTGAGAPVKVRVLLLSGETLFGEAVSVCIDGHDGVEVVGLTLDAAQVVEAVSVLRPSVLVVDQRSLGTGVPTVVARAREVQPSLRAVLLATVAGPTPAEDAAFDAVVPPRSSLDRVVAAVREVAWYRDAPVAAVPEALPELTAREREVLTLLSRGAGTSAIAGQLHLSQHTVRNHVRNVLGKLEVHSRLEAITEGRRLGLV